MEESKYSTEVYSRFESEFTVGWIDALNWSNKEERRKSLRVGLERIENFRLFLFLSYCKLVLSADHLLSKFEKLDSLLEAATEDVPITDSSLKSKLKDKYSCMLLDICDAVSLVKYHCCNTIHRYEYPNTDTGSTFINAINYSTSRSNRDGLVNVLGMICEACWCEYVFSYDEDFIRRLLVLKENLTLAKKSIPQKIEEVVNPTIQKLELLLAKLSFYSKNKEIKYTFNFRTETIQLKDTSTYTENDFRTLFIKFLDPEKIDGETVRRWQLDSLGKDVAMWKLAFLMRYYTKKTKSLQQIDRLMEVAQRHHSEYVGQRDGNLVNEYADRSFLNYMYNSRFSARCKDERGFSFRELVCELETIRAIQNETFIFSYHPYQKAMEYTFNYLEKILHGESTEDDAVYVFKFLEECYDKFKDNLEWCKNFQPYLMQMRFKFSTVEDQAANFGVFYPSSFCRPIKFAVLDEKSVQYNNQISHLKFQLSHIDERRQIIDAQNKIADVERKNLQNMGFFFTVTTFLVGLLSIFIGNSGNVSILSKMEYVIVLGVILILFVSLGYFALSDFTHWVKKIIFGIFAVVSLSTLMLFFLRLVLY